MIVGELVKFRSRSGYIHDGLFAPAKTGRLGIIAVHGSLQNFYGNLFTAVMANVYPKAGINFLSFNLRCHDGISEGEFSDGHVEYVGGSLSAFDSCIEDIAAAVAWMRQRCDQLILQGHSLGCDRVVHHLKTTKESDIGVVLLGPCDSRALHLRFLRGKTLATQQRRIRKLVAHAHQFQVLEPSEYGVNRGKNWTYSIPISARALLSIIEGPPFKLFDLSNRCSFSLGNKALALIGEHDVLAPSERDKMFDLLRTGFRKLDYGILAGADHCFSGKEAKLTQRITRWAKRWRSGD